MSAAIPPHVLITGGAGYIGSHVAHALVDRGWSVTVLDDLSNGDPRLLPAGIRFVHTDFADREALAALLPHTDAVMHFAGSIVVPESVDHPLSYWTNNTLKTHALIDAAAAARIKAFVFSSTAAVYGEPSSTPIPESAPKNPINPYGQTKLAVEWILGAVGTTHRLPWSALRYFNVAGADPAGRTGQLGRSATHLIKIATRMAARSESGIRIFGDDYATPDGTCIRDYVHVHDLAHAHLLALDRLLSGQPSTAFNVGYGTGASVRDVIDAVERVAGRDLSPVVAPRRSGDPARLVADASALAAATGWRPTRDHLDQIVADALAWEISISPQATADTSNHQGTDTCSTC